MVYLDNQTRGSGLDTRALVRVLERLLAEIGEAGSSVSLTFVRDPAKRALNREHRGKDAPTDVLSFPLYAARVVRPPRRDTAVHRQRCVRCGRRGRCRQREQPR